MVGKDEQAVLAETRRDKLRSVFTLGSDAFQATTASVLRSEGLNRRVPDIVILTEGDNDRSLFNEVLSVHGKRHGVDKGTAFIAVSVDHLGQFFFQNRQTARPRCEDILKVGDDEFQFLVLILNLGNIKRLSW